MLDSDPRIPDDLQSILPAGIIVQDLVPEDWVGNVGEQQRLWLYRVEDQRGGEPQERLVRVVRVGAAPWKEKFRERLRLWAAQPMPYVSRPLEIGFSADDSICYVVTDRLGQPVSDAAFWRSKGLAEEEFVSILRQILAGLSALHDAGLIHGDVRAGNIILDPATSNGRTAWLTGVATGRLAEWTQQELMPAQATIGRATFQTDVHHLGVAAVEMLVGHAHVPDDLSRNRRVFRQAIKQKGGVRRPTRRALWQLLQASPQHPVAARDVLAKLNAPHPGWCWAAVLSAFALVVVVVALFWGSLDHGSPKPATKEDVAAVQSEVKEARSHFEKGLDEIANKLSSIDKRTGDIASTDPESPEQLAKEAWQTALSKSSQETAREAFESIQRWIQDENDAEIRRWVLEWFNKGVKPAYTRSLEWASGELEDEMLKFIRSPWDETARERHKAKLDTLDGARDLWREWVYDGEMTMADLEKAIGRRKDDEREIINTWYDALKNFAPVLHYKSGTAPAGYGTTRAIGVWTDSEGWKWGPVHQWPRPTQCTYTKGGLRFDWNPGDRVQVNLQGPLGWRTGYTNRPDYIEHLFNGPLALWRAARAGRVSQDGFTLKYEIVGPKGERCPGPPDESEKLSGTLSSIPSN